jgi:hypothetical protein
MQLQALLVEMGASGPGNVVQEGVR